MRQELRQVKFHGKFIALRKTMKLRISIFMTKKNRLMGLKKWDFHQTGIQCATL